MEKLNLLGPTNSVADQNERPKERGIAWPAIKPRSRLPRCRASARRILRSDFSFALPGRLLNVLFMALGFYRFLVKGWLR